ncbi:MAG: hypothetical protein CM1200mP21_09050 [Candidatus Poseidoniales archaeon]|nr:MAG: hypothetical protein CM1200mP21_09050 [Candidatus Poseidoniales archaeon]
MSPTLSLAVFILSLAGSIEVSKKDPNTIAGAILLASLAYLSLYGPSSLGFGLCIGSGWTILNRAAFRMFPQ